MAYRAHAWLSEFVEYPNPEISAWTGHQLSSIADCSDCPTTGPDCEYCRCIGQALVLFLSKYPLHENVKVSTRIFKLLGHGGSLVGFGAFGVEGHWFESN